MIDGGPGVLLIAALVVASAIGGMKAAKETNRHVVQPVKHAIVRVLKKL
jgi:hypothetical protein